jgi:hypothetical protein
MQREMRETKKALVEAMRQQEQKFQARAVSIPPFPNDNVVAVTRTQLIAMTA